VSPASNFCGSVNFPLPPRARNVRPRDDAATLARTAGSNIGLNTRRSADSFGFGRPLPAKPASRAAARWRSLPSGDHVLPFALHVRLQKSCAVLFPACRFVNSWPQNLQTPTHKGKRPACPIARPAHAREQNRGVRLAFRFTCAVVPHASQVTVTKGGKLGRFDIPKLPGPNAMVMGANKRSAIRQGDTD
jgi:hypothetical protein